MFRAVAYDACCMLYAPRNVACCMLFTELYVACCMLCALCQVQLLADQYGDAISLAVLHPLQLHLLHTAPAHARSRAVERGGAGASALMDRIELVVCGSVRR